MKRVVITGQGTINALGHDVAQTLQAFQNGTCGIGALDITDVDRLSIKIGAQVTGYDAGHIFTPKQISLYDRATQFAQIAAQQAVAQSGIVFDGALAEQSGVIMGTAGGGLTTSDDSYRSVYQDGKNRVHPFVVPRLMHNAATSAISMTHNLLGPSYTVATACAASNHAMGQAFQMIRSGHAPAMITGGAEAMLCFGGIKAWEGLRVLSPDGCRPFCATRNGMVMGEGAAVFVFEDYDHARARGAEILAEVAGFAMTSDGGDIVMPNQQGAERAMNGALRDAGLCADDIGYINAHGTGTAANDKVECGAISQVFGRHAENLMVSSTKAMHGHLIGATGAVEMLASIMALRDGVIAPTIGHQQNDPHCDLDVTPNEARHANVAAVLSNAFAFGGLNAVLALKKI